MEEIAEDVNHAPDAKAVVEEGIATSVLHWIAFTVVNAAPFALALGTSWAYWWLGFIFWICYLFVAVAVVLFLERRDRQRYHTFINLFWVIICTLVLIIGSYLSVGAIGPWEEETTSSWKPKAPEQLASLLSAVPNASQDLINWAGSATTDIALARTIFFAGYVFLSTDDGDGNRPLFRVDSLTAGFSIQSRVFPINGTSTAASALQNARGFMQVGADLYFFATENLTNSRWYACESDCLWMIPGSSPNGVASPLIEFNQTSGYGSSINIVSTFVESPSFYFKVSRTCSGRTDYTIFRSDGTKNGTVDLDPGAACRSILPNPTPPALVRPPFKRVISELFLGVLPQTVLAFVLLYFKRLPGLFLNIYVGLWSIAFVLWLICSPMNDLTDLAVFLQATLSAYSAVSYVVLIFVRIPRGEGHAWLQEMKTWAVSVVALVFFGIIHYDLNIPLSNAWRDWIIYGVLQLVQIFMALLIRRKLPLILAYIGTLITCYKITFEAINGMNLGLTPEVKLILQLAFLMVLGSAVTFLSLTLARVARREKEAVSKHMSFFIMEEDRDIVAISSEPAPIVEEAPMPRPVLKEASSFDSERRFSVPPSQPMLKGAASISSVSIEEIPEPRSDHAIRASHASTGTSLPRMMTLPGALSTAHEEHHEEFDEEEV